MKYVLTLVAAAAACTAIATTAFAEDAGPSNRHPVAAMNVAALSATKVPPANASDWKTVNDALPASRDDGWGPVAGALRPASEGRTLIDQDGRRLTLIPASTGELCFQATKADAPIMNGCSAGLPDAGMLVGFVRQAGFSMDVMGFVEADVDAIQVETADGKVHPVEIQNSGYWWSNDDSVTVRAVHSIKDGQKSSATSIFAYPEL